MKHILWGALCALALAGLAVFFYFCDPAKSLLVPKCPFKLLTVWDCPSCGGQRAAHALLHGHIGEAIAVNPFFLLGFPVLLFVIAVHLRLHRRSVREGHELTANDLLLLRIRKIAVIIYLIAYLAWFVIRNI